jgi:hypothetical protein
MTDVLTPTEAPNGARRRLGTLLAPNRLEGCYAHFSAATRVASCTEFTKQ